MDINGLRADIKSNNIAPFYVFTGVELEVQWIYIREIEKRVKSPAKYVNSIADIYGRRQSSIIKTSYCYILRDDKEILTNEKLQEQFRAGNYGIGNNHLILLLTDVDKRTKFYKNFKNQIIEFEPLSEQLLTKYIQKEISLNEKNCSKLIDICESSYGRILLEIDKIKQYRKALDLTRDDEMTDDYFFDKLIQDGTIYQPPKDAIFDFIDAVLRRQPERSFKLLQESYDSGEATMVLLQVLYTNLKQMLQVQSCKSNDISKSTGLTGWQVKCMQERIGKWRIGELVRFLHQVREAEVGIKTGRIEEDLAIHYILAKNL